MTEDGVLKVTNEYLGGGMTTHAYRNLLIVELMNLRVSRALSRTSEDDNRLSKIANAISQIRP